MMVSKFFGTLRNVYNFFVLYSNQDNMEPAELSVDYADRPELDRWILSKYNQLIKDVTEVYGSLRSHEVRESRFSEFVVEDLSNWYIRRARRRFWGEETERKTRESVYATTYEVLVGVAKLIAPFAPFIADEMYVNLTGEESVHIAYFPKADEARIDARSRRDGWIWCAPLWDWDAVPSEKERIKVRQPLSEILVDGKYEELIGDLTPLIMEELNVKKVVFEKELDQYMNYSLKPNFKVAGPILGK